MNKTEQRAQVQGSKVTIQHALTEPLVDVKTSPLVPHNIQLLAGTVSIASVRRFLLLFCALLTPLSQSSARSPDTLVVGMELAYPPFEMADTKGAPSGISVDLATALAEALHRKLEIQNLPFDGLIPSLKTGKIDIILSSMTATPERAKAIDFSNPYLKTGLCLLIPKNSSVTSIKELDLTKNVIAIKQGTTGQLYATKNLHSAKLLVLDRESACVLEVVQGKANAFIYDQMSILKHWQQNPDTTQAILTPIQEECWAIGLQKGNNELREKINVFLNDFRNKGGFDALGEKWLTEQKQQFKKLGIPFIF